MQLSLFKSLLPSFKKSKAEIAPLKPPRKTGASDPLLKDLWLTLRVQYFESRADLDTWRILWSGRPQKRTLASCSTEIKTVRVARELNYPQWRFVLEPLLYHEMCHAVLDGRAAEGRPHGPEFKRLERQHPQVAAFNTWAKEGGFTSAIRSDRSKRAWQKRK